MEDKKELNSHEITQMNLAYKRTDLSIIRTELAISNTKLSVEQTHLSFLRTIVSLIGFLVLAAVYFIIRDRLTYPRLKAKIKDIEEQKERLVLERRYSEEADD